MLSAPDCAGGFSLFFQTRVLRLAPAEFMAVKFFNTLSRAVQEFVPRDPAGRLVQMYCCGPTVYDFAHIGNWRTFVFADLVRRTLDRAFATAAASSLRLSATAARNWSGSSAWLGRADPDVSRAATVA